MLWALALWYYYGWRLADKWANHSTLALLFLISWVFFTLLPFVKDPILVLISTNISNVQVSSIVASFFLLTPMSFVLGAIQPIATKIHMSDLASSWKVIGRVWSIGTVWSIVGTLAAGFFLIPYFGVTLLLVALAFASLILAIICKPKKFILFHIAIIGLCIFTIFYHVWKVKILSDNGTHIIETVYSHVTVGESMQDRRPTRKLYIDNITHAGMFLWSTDLVHEYTKYYHLFDVLVENARDVVMFWGSAYGYPKNFLSTYSDKNIDVVEIDPKVTEIAKKYFDLQESPRLNITHGDARVFINKNEKKYDAILWDAFGSYFSLPYQLTTLETAQRKYESLNDNWVVILNLVSSISGEKAQFLEAEYKTYKEVFPEVFILPVRSTEQSVVQNIMLIAAKNPETLNFKTDNLTYASYLSKKAYLDIPEDTPILTDDYAPVDSFISALTKNN